jgi:hypothetical protein
LLNHKGGGSRYVRISVYHAISIDIEQCHSGIKQHYLSSLIQEFLAMIALQKMCVNTHLLQGMVCLFFGEISTWMFAAFCMHQRVHFFLHGVAIKRITF